MSRLQPNRFTSWSLDPQEETNGALLNFAQEQVMQNEMAMAAEQLINLDYTPNDPITYAMNKVKLQTEIRVYQFIIDRSNLAKKQLDELAQMSAQSQSSRNR